MKKPLPPPDKTFLRLEGVGTRWCRNIRVARRLLKQFGVPVYRLTGTSHLYKVSDLEAIENASRYKAPKPGNPAWRKEQAP